MCSFPGTVHGKYHGLLQDGTSLGLNPHTSTGTPGFHKMQGVSRLHEQSASQEGPWLMF
jgi:hypothetical protein